MSKWWQGIKGRFEGRSRKHVLLVAAITAWLIVFVLLVVFLWPSSRSGRATYVTTLAQVLGGSALLVGLFFTYRTVEASHETLELTREGQVTDRFYKAIEQLGNDNEDVRIGALLALERLAGDSPRETSAVITVISGFIRRSTQHHLDLASLSDPEKSAMHDAGEKCSEEVQVSLDVLFRLRSKAQEAAPTSVNLAGSDLRGARFYNSNVGLCDFSNCILDDAEFSFCDVATSLFDGSLLRRATFRICDLANSSLMGTDLSDAGFSYFTKVGSGLGWSVRGNLNLSDHFVRVQQPQDWIERWGEKDGGELLYRTLFHGSTLRSTDFREVDLRRVLGLTKEQIASALTDGHTLLPDYL